MRNADRSRHTIFSSIGDYLLASGEPDEALTVYRRLIAERPGDRNLDRAYLGAGRAMLQKDRCETAAWHYLVAAVDLAQSSQVAEDARRYMKMIDQAGDGD